MMIMDYAFRVSNPEASMSLSISSQPQSNTQRSDSGANEFAQAVQQQQKQQQTGGPGMPQPTVSGTVRVGTTGPISTQAADLNVSVPLDSENTRVGVTYTDARNLGVNATGAPVDNTVQSVTTTVSRPVAGVTANGSLTLEANTNNLTGATTETAAVRLGASDTFRLGPRTNATVSGTVGLSATTPPTGETSLVAQPRLSAGVTQRVGDATIGAQVNVGGNIGLNDAGRTAVSTAGNDVVVTGQITGRVPLSDTVTLTGSVTQGFAGAGNPSTNPQAGAFSPGRGQTAAQIGVQVTLP